MEDDDVWRSRVASQEGTNPHVHKMLLPSTRFPGTHFFYFAFSCIAQSAQHSTAQHSKRDNLKRHERSEQKEKDKVLGVSAFLHIYLIPLGR